MFVAWRYCRGGGYLYWPIAPKNPQPVKFSSCKALKKKFPGGVAKSSAKVKAASLKKKPKIWSAMYKLNSKFDFNKNGIICETLKVNLVATPVIGTPQNPANIGESVIFDGYEYTLMNFPEHDDDYMCSAVPDSGSVAGCLYSKNGYLLNTEVHGVDPNWDKTWIALNLKAKRLPGSLINYGFGYGNFGLYTPGVSGLYLWKKWEEPVFNGMYHFDYTRPFVEGEERIIRFHIAIHKTANIGKMAFVVQDPIDSSSSRYFFPIN